MSRCLIIFALFAFASAALGPIKAQDATKEKTVSPPNRFTKPGDVNQGRQLVRGSCSRCHGIDGRGGKGPDLTDGNFRHGDSDEEILRNIRDGIPGTGMAGFGDGLDEWNWQILSYLRSEAYKRAQEEKTQLAGNSARGYELFEKHKCGGCHWSPSSRGRRGPSLIDLRSTADYVRNSLLSPDSQIDGSYQPLTIVMNDGSVRQGMRLHENSYYILLMDENEQLQTIAKEDIDELRKPHKSLMPSFAKELTTQDVEDLATYLFSLQKDPTR